MCHLFICVLFARVQLEFNSHLTSERRSTEITDDYSSNHDRQRTFLCIQNHTHLKRSLYKCVSFFPRRQVLETVDHRKRESHLQQFLEYLQMLIL